jgi:hypothetical protein
MGAASVAKAGVGSAVNDATRILGGTLGVAVIGSIYASIYASHLTESLPGQLPASIADSAQRSVGTAFGAAAQLSAAGQPSLARGLDDAPQMPSSTASRPPSWWRSRSLWPVRSRRRS